MRRLLLNFRRFVSDRRGNIAILFGLAVVPVFGIMGAALDYSMANMERTRIQAALDNTALTLSKMMPLTDDQANADGWKIFQANFGASPLIYAQPNLTVSQADNGKLILQVNTTYPLKVASILSKFMGMSPTMPVDAHSEVQWGNTRLRVALALDNTGSMADDGKMDALKTATANLLTTLQNAARTPDDVYVSIIPFSKDVNVGAQSTDPSGVKTYNQSGWIYWGDATQDPSQNDSKSWDAINGSCSISSKSTRSSCNSATKCSISGNNNQSSCESDGKCSVSGNNSQSSCQSDGKCSISGKNSQSACQSAFACSKNPSSNNTQSKCTQHNGSWNAGVWTAGVWTPGVWTVGTWTPDDHSTWNGCVTDRGTTSGPSPSTQAGNDQKVDLPSGTNDSLWPAEQFNSCTQEIVGLTSDWTTLNSTVTNMESVGNTNQPIGLVWAWQSLVGGGPLIAPAEDATYAYSHTIILMSDGLNTQNRWTTSASSIDNRMFSGSGSSIAGTCKNIKDTGVQIFAVQVNTGGDPTSTLLQNCATDPSMFFELTKADALVDTFAKIGSALANIHISK